jgi:shikimate kinase
VREQGRRDEEARGTAGRAEGPPLPPPRIALIGFMGSGKTTVGRLLARRIGWAFVDLDTLIVEKAGKSVAEIFSDSGEAAFREIESRCLRELGDRERVVVAAGGGAAVAEANRGFFAAASTFHLAVSLETALTRTGADTARPLLSRGPAVLRELFASRLPVYRSLGAEVDTEGRGPEEVAAVIVRLLGLTSREGDRGRSSP